MVLVAASTAQALTRSPNTLETTSRDELGLGPGRLELDVSAGDTKEFKAALLNYSRNPRNVRLTSTHVGPTGDENEFVQRLKNYEFGAGDWLHPELTEITLQPGEAVNFMIKVIVPDDASPGSHYAGIAATTAPDETVAGNQVAVQGEVLMQIFLNVAGDRHTQGHITEAVPTDQYVFSMRSFVAYRVVYANEGNVTDHVKGTLSLYSVLGNKVDTLEIPEYRVVRGTKRSFNVLWTDPPRFGRFTGKVRLETDDGVKFADVKAVTLLPPKGMLWIPFVVLLIPIIVMWRNRRQDWREYLDDVDEDEFDDLEAF